MKLYVIYCKIPKPIYQEMNNNVFDYNPGLYDDRGIMTGMYAFTNKKELFLNFCTSHKVGKNEYLYVVKEKITKEDYMLFRREYGSCEIKPHHIRFNNTEIAYMAFASHEICSFTNFKLEILNELMDDVVDEAISFQIFNNMIINELFTLGYCDMWADKHEADENGYVESIDELEEIRSIIEMLYYNSSYASPPRYNGFVNELGLFVRIYDRLLDKEGIFDCVSVSEKKGVEEDGEEPLFF